MTDHSTSFTTRTPTAVPRSAQTLFGVLAGLHHGRLDIVGPARQRFSFPASLPGPEAVLYLEDWDVCDDILRAGDIGLAEAFIAGRWHTPDLAAVLALAALNHAALTRAVYGRWWGLLVYRLTHLLRANTRRGSRRNIHAHYDLGNEFYASWLDATMTYSSALFDGEQSRTLEEAQLAKYERILSRLAPRPGSRILEVGCGWGGFAEYAARTRGCSVHGITLSERQFSYAQQRIERAGLGAKVRFARCDYRDVTGTFDHIVSIEMYEAVGERFWPKYFSSIRERLAPGGRALLQMIVIADELFARYRRQTDFIQQHIFPGGMLASPLAMRAVAAQAGLRVGEVFAFGLDYAETLKRWRQRFNHGRNLFAGERFDARFERLWNFYLAYCEAGFRAGTTDVLQVEMINA
jgi:cyclopropane-fatty-acyl-phospholipid synthase